MPKHLQNTRKRTPAPFKHLSFLLLLLLCLLQESHSAITHVSVTPTGSGFFIGELSFPQLLAMGLVFLKIVVLNSVGVLPVKIDLKYAWDALVYVVQGRGMSWWGPESGGGVGEDVDEDMEEEKELLAKQVGPSFLLDCPLQFVCEVDEWAHRDHDGLLENLLALWFRNPKKRWRRPEAAAFSGVGSCREMHPCPFDVQDAVGFRIPGAGVTQQDSPAAAFLAAAPSASPYVDAVVTPYSVM